MNKPIICLMVFIGLAASNCDFSQNFCCLSGFTCPNVGSFVIGNSSYGLGDFNVVSFNDVTINNGDVQGRVAARNNVYGTNGISLGDLLNDTFQYSVIAGGNIQISGSGLISPASQNVFAGSSGSVVPQELINRVVVGCGSSGCLNSVFDALQQYWSSFSSSLSLVSPNVDVSITNGVASISCQSSSANAYYVRFTPSDFNSVTSYVLSGNCQATASLVINIIGNDDVIFGGDSPNTTAAYTIFNVGPSATVRINSSVYGNIVAPNSNINVLKGTIFGQLIANNITNVVQVNTITESRSCQTRPSNNGGNCVNSGSFATTGSATTGVISGGESAANSGQGANNGNTSSALMSTLSVLATVVAIALL